MLEEKHLKEWLSFQFKGETSKAIKPLAKGLATPETHTHLVNVEKYRKFEEGIWINLNRQLATSNYNNILELLSRHPLANRTISISSFKELLMWVAIEDLAKELVNERRAEDASK